MATSQNGKQFENSGNIFKDIARFSSDAIDQALLAVEVDIQGELDKILFQLGKTKSKRNTLKNKSKKKRLLNFRIPKCTKGVFYHKYNKKWRILILLIILNLNGKAI